MNLLLKLILYVLHISILTQGGKNQGHTINSYKLILNIGSSDF